MDEQYGRQERGSADAYASYFAGMDASMQQKVALTTAHFPTSGVVADMGSGSGRGTYDLACLHPGLDLVGVDINPAAVASAAASYRRGNLRYQAGDIADPLFAPGSLDGILDSSVLHHVTSFTGYSTARLEECLDHQVAALRPGGVLIIRDFVVPDGPAEVLLDLPANDGGQYGVDECPPDALSTWALWRRYAATVRNSRHQPGTLPWAELGMVPGRPGWRRVRCALRDAQEFLLRKDYRADWDVELVEEYTWWTQAQFVAALERRGLRVVAAAPIRNPWIVANRYRGRARLATVADEDLPFPPTNLLVVGEKVATGHGTRLRLLDGSAPLASPPDGAPAFLRLQGWRGDDGSAYDLAQRPGRTIDLLPWAARDGRVTVLARQGFPRPLVVADPQRPDLSGARWSGYLTEPLAAIARDDEPLEQAVPRILAERAGLAVDQLRGLGRPRRYATSPGGFDEVVTAVAVEVAEEVLHAACPRSYGDLAESGTVRALDARACLRAAQVGGLFDARLELSIHRLLRHRALPPGPWIGAACAVPDHALDWPIDLRALTPPAGPTFAPTAALAGYLTLRQGSFAELAADGSTLTTVSREWVMPLRTSTNTATVLPLVRIHGTVRVGVEHRWLPAIQVATGTSAFAAVPAWRLPTTVDRLDRAETWLADHLLTQHRCRVTDLIELGGPYLATPGATPELVHPWLAVIDPATGPGKLHWLPLADCLDDEHGLVDTHLAIAVHRAAHALGLLG